MIPDEQSGKSQNNHKHLKHLQCSFNRTEQSFRTVSWKVVALTTNQLDPFFPAVILGEISCKKLLVPCFDINRRGEMDVARTSSNCKCSVAPYRTVNWHLGVGPYQPVLPVRMRPITAYHIQQPREGELSIRARWQSGNFNWSTPEAYDVCGARVATVCVVPHYV